MTSDEELAGLRRSYETPGLLETALASAPQTQFRSWFDDALASGVVEPNAMTLATADADGHPAARTVLLKGLDRRGFMFATNLASAKGRQIAVNPSVAAVFLWHQLSRQVCIRGFAHVAEPAESDAYFASRPREHQLGAWASQQSDVIESRATLSDSFARLEQEFPLGSEIPRPPHWGCIIIAPDSIEFWQGQPSRLHDRLRYIRVGDGGLDDGASWRIERLAP
ncbi:MAG: pyridoxamine 5'-phosphate oxidase [Actinobacteria bacterium]|nr:pyridoxamine 5'-phosphate oxidase [Actinomycetota bacterium]